MHSPSSSDQKIWVILDSSFSLLTPNLSMNICHLKSVTGCAFRKHSESKHFSHHLYWSQPWLTQATIISLIDYYNSLLIGLTDSTQYIPTQQPDQAFYNITQHLTPQWSQFTQRSPSPNIPSPTSLMSPLTTVAVTNRDPVTQNSLVFPMHTRHTSTIGPYIDCYLCLEYSSPQKTAQLIPSLVSKSVQLSVPWGLPLLISLKLQPSAPYLSNYF